MNKDVEIAKLISITVKTTDGQTVEISKEDLDLYLNSKVKGFYYESDDGDLFIPLTNE